MRHLIEIPYGEINEDIIDQSNQEFKAMRASNPDKADALNLVYEDWVMTPADDRAIRKEIEKSFSALYQKIRAYCPAFELGRDKLILIVDSEDCNTPARLVPMIKNILESDVLSWWYRTRDYGLSQKYDLASAAAQSEVNSILIPMFTTYKTRMF